MSRVIELIVTAQGEVTVLTKGFSGGTCLQASKWLEQAALGVATADHKTAEFHQSAAIEQHVQQQ